MDNKPKFGRPGTGRPEGGKRLPQVQRPYGKPEMRARSNADPRIVAVTVIEDVLENEAYASLSLDDRLNEVNLNQLDRRLCASIVYRTLENLYRLDFALARFLRDADALPMQVRIILRAAACQILLFDRVPDSAAVNEAVKQTRALHLDGFSGMVNAVQHRLVEGKDQIAWPEETDRVHYLAVTCSVPEWLVQRLIDDYGWETAKQIASFRTEKHFVTLRPTYGREKEFSERIGRKVWTTESGVLPGSLRVYGAMQLARDNDYLDGLYSIQGEGSTIAAMALGARRGMNVLDCCAAPGGKTAYIAERMEGTGRVYAWDLHDHRVALIRAAIRRLHLENVRVAARDAVVFKEDLADTMDAVLIDAPCSGLGVMDDKPDVKYRPTPESVTGLCETQRMLLDTCCRYVRPGGILVYSTCTLLKDENERQIAAFLERHPEFEIDALPDSIPEILRAQAGANGLQLLPYRDGVEGFFVARMKRRG